MGLFDHLFKPRPEDALERIVEAPLKASARLEKSADSGADSAPDLEATFLQPKGYAAPGSSPALGDKNQGFVPILPTARRPPAAERRTASPEDRAPACNEVVLSVGDVLPRIPFGLLRPGPHDLKRPLRFRIEHLSPDIARGKPGIALSVIAEQCPELFHGPITDDEDMEIRLPLQKIVEQVSRIRATAPATLRLPAEAPVAPSRIEPLPPHIEPVAPISPPPHEEKSEAPPPVHAPPSEPVHRPVIPPPAILQPAPPPPPVEVIPVAPAPTSIEPARPEPPPPAASPAPSIVAPPAPEPEPASPGAVAEPALPAPVVPLVEEPTPPTPPHSALPDTIDLGLAAIVARLPTEFLVGSRPHIDEGYRVALPFPMIERQLGTGTVEIPGSLFWSAVPPLLKHHFVHRDDLTVPLPLEEIFQNLPVAASAEKVRFDPGAAPLQPASEPAPPIVLAPAPHDEATPELGFDIAPPPAAELLSPPATADTDAAAESASPPLAPPPPDAPVAAEAAPASPPASQPEPAPLEVAASPKVEPAPASDPAISAPPGEEAAAPVSLQPFRVYTPPTPAFEAEATPAPETLEPITLGASPDAAATTTPDAAQILRPSILPESKEGADPDPSGVASATEDTDMQPAAEPPLENLPQPAAPQFSVLPSPAVPPPEADSFTPDQPPPLQVEAPAAVAAVLHATVAAPQESPLFASATTSVPAPRLFRPIVLPPPISGEGASPAVRLAPTLAGTGAPAAGMISLAPRIAPAHAASPAAESPGHLAPAPSPAPAPAPVPAAPAPQPEPAPALAATEQKPTLRDLARRLFSPPPAAAEVPANPPAASAAPAAAETPAPPAAPIASPAPVAPASAPAAMPAVSELHLQIPPLPHAAAPAPAHHEATPPALPISRFDQHSLQSLFMTEETLDLPKVSRLSAALPGILACIVSTRDETVTGGNLPEGFDLAALRGLAPQVGAAAVRLPIGELKNFTLYGGEYSVSFFERRTVCLCAVHRTRAFVPGVREKLAAITDELARG